MCCAVLVTGCQSHETSSDQTPGGDPSMAFGVLTHTIIRVVRGFKEANPDDPISSRSVCPLMSEKYVQFMCTCVFALACALNLCQLLASHVQHTQLGWSHTLDHVAPGFQLCSEYPSD